MQQFTDFFAFRTFISLNLLRLIYAVGWLGLCLWALALFLTPVGPLTLTSPLIPGAPVTQVNGVLILVVGNILWRVLCEGFILFFRIHEQLQTVTNVLQDIASQQEYQMDQFDALITQGDRAHLPRRVRPARPTALNLPPP